MILLALALQAAPLAPDEVERASEKAVVACPLLWQTPDPAAAIPAFMDKEEMSYPERIIMYGVCNGYGQGVIDGMKKAQEIMRAP